MPTRTRTRKKPQTRARRAAPRRRQRSLPTLLSLRFEQHQLDLLGLGLAAGSFGLGPDHPVRHGFFHSDYFRHHGGVVGDAMFFVAKTLFSSFGAHIVFVFLMLAGVLLITGGSVAGIITATRAGVLSTTQRIRGRTSEFEARRPPRRWDEPLDEDDLPPVPADVEPV